MVTFQAVAWDGSDVDDKYVIRIFGRTEDGRSVSLGTTFEPFLYVKGCKDVSFLQTKCYSVEKRKSVDLWGFRNGQLEDFLLIKFRTQRGLRNFTYNTWPEMRGATIHESNIDPILRFMHVSGISSTGWIDTGTCEMDPDTTCYLNLWQPKWKNLMPVLKDAIAPFKIMSFDIECYSSTGAFPDPRNPNDVVFQIGMTTMTFGTPDVEKTCLCLKQTDGYPSFDSERDLLIAFEKHLKKVDPDIITGWNIFGFDLEFLLYRATLNKLRPVWGRMKDSVAEIVVKNLSSSALGNNELKMVPMKGRYVFDLFQDVKREHKLESYSLNNVSKHFLNEKKNDMPVREIFSRYANGDSRLLAEVADYCVQDTVLPLNLLVKLCQIQNQVEMAKACWVPLSFLSERGQQIKVFSQMAYKARKLNFILPTFKKGSMPTGDEGYEGATVLEAQAGAYYGPITALDFASLYPSIMCAHNLCYSTLVMDPKYDNLPGVEYEQFGPHRFAQNVPSLLPVILTDLKAFRKKAKKLMAQSEGTPMEAIYNGQQLAYKMSMNSMYGFTGASKGMLPLVAIASTVTMRGRQMIEETKNYVEKNFPGAKVRYGDSVTSDTHVIFRKDGKTFTAPIFHLGKCQKWVPYEGFLKQGTNKEMAELEGFEAWTHLGWKPIKRIIRHNCDKKIFRVITPSGDVEVTEDHSLLNQSLEQVKPKNLNIGDKLYHLFPEFDTIEDYYPHLFKGQPPIRFDHITNEEEATIQWPRRIYGGSTSQLMYLRLRKSGVDVRINRDGAIAWSKRKHNRDPDAIIRIEEVEYYDATKQHVYDLETEAGTFQAGTGCMIVKNTDSVMVEFDVQGRKGQEAIDYSWVQGELAAEACTKLFKAPNDLELEKVYCPYFLYSKKRYAAKMYEKRTFQDGRPPAVVFKKVDIKGLQVVRRDSCPFVRETLKTLLNMILDSSDPRPVIEFARKCGRDLMTGKIPIEKLLMSKQLASSYKVPVPHVTVRDKMKHRAPGSEPQQGDRVSFVVIQGPGKMYEKAEDPVWAVQHTIPLDYHYYFTNQFKKPVQDLLEPLIDPSTIFDKKFTVSAETTVEMAARKAFLARFARAAT